MKDENKNHILFLDDDIESLHALKLIFKNKYNVHLASNSKNALNLLTTLNIKVLLVDQQMPDISGLDFCKIVNKKFSHIVCIIVTAYSNQDVLYNAINQGGIYQLIKKPWEKDNLNNIIENAIEKHDLIEQNQKLVRDLESKNKELTEKNEVLTITAEVLKENEKELLDYNKKLLLSKMKAEESDRLKTAFLGNISHEIRTPLNGIIGFIELLLNIKNEHISAKAKSYISIIRQSSNQLLSIINDLIDISKIEAGAVFIKQDEFDLDIILKQLLRDYALKFEQKNILFFVDNQLMEPLYTDKHKLLQILKHLIDNAYKYTSFGSVELTIIRINNSVIFKIKDTGIGIAKHYYDKIWDRFTQLELENTTVNMGNGIGLTLVKAFVEILNGTVTLNSKENKGTEFVVTLPFLNKAETFSNAQKQIESKKV